MNEFEKLVAEMRHAQKRYFETRSKNYWLPLSKQLEHQVDQHLQNINQPKLFSNDQES